MDDGIPVTFWPAGITGLAERGETVLDVALRLGIDIPHECGGNCSCTTCHVYVTSEPGHLSAMEEPESYRLQFAEGLRPESRLACQALVLRGPVTVTRASEE